MHNIPLFHQTFCFLRHGESSANLARIVGGALDVELTRRGQAQAHCAMEKLRLLDITAIYCSTLRRARDTAAPIARALGLPATEIADIGERHWGVMQGQPLASRVPGALPEGAETIKQFTQRVLQGFAKITPGDYPLIVSHSGVYRTLCRTLGITESATPVSNAQPLRLVPPNAARSNWLVEPL